MLKFVFHILVFLVCAMSVQAQEKDRNFQLQSFGLQFQDGTFQFFDSYNSEILRTNARAGLPLYNDWILFSGPVHLPEFFQFGANAAWVDSSRGLKIRGGLTFFRRADSLTTTRDFIFLDTIIGRNASERGDFYGITFSIMKQTRKVLKCFRFYGGARFESGFSPQSQIRFYEYAYDLSEQDFLDYNEFSTTGKPRLTVYGSALLGFETVFFHRIGLVAEVQSGIGTQIVVREPSYGFGKNSFSLGVNYYLFDYQRKKAAAIPLEEYEPYVE